MRSGIGTVRLFIAFLISPGVVVAQAPVRAVTPPKGTAAPAKTALRAQEQRILALSRGLYRLSSLGDSAILSARIFGENFRPIAGEPIAWRSDDEGIAAAAPTGVVSAMKNGSTRIWARSGSDSVFAVVTVEQRPVKLTFNLGSPIVFDALGASASLRAEQRDARGNPVRGDFPISTGCKLRDEGGSGAVQMSAGAKLTARANGAATLTCNKGSVKDEIKIVVRQAVFAAKVAPSDTVLLAEAGDTVRLSIQAFDRLGKPIADARALWSSLTPEIVDVEGGSGLVLGKALGTGKLAAKFETTTDTVTVNVLAALPEGKSLPSLARARPAPPPTPVVQAPTTAPVSAARASSLGVPAPLSTAPLSAAPFPSAQRAFSVTAPSRRAASAATFADASGSSAASDSVAIQRIIDAQVSNTTKTGRTWIITPMALQSEYRSVGISNPNPTGAVAPFAARSSQLRAAPGTLIGIAGQVQLFRALYVDGQYASGTLKATTGVVTTDSVGKTVTTPSDGLADGGMRDWRFDVGFRALPGLAFRVGYAQKTIDTPIKFQLTYVRTGLDGEFSLFGDRIHSMIGFTYMPSVTASSGNKPSTSMGGNAGVEYRGGWFTAGVEYQVESFEYTKDAAFNDTFQVEDRFSALRLRLGVHFGR